MPLPKSLTQPVRVDELLIGAGWRAFFAPFNAALAVTTSNTSKGPNIIDLNNTGPFNTNSPPTGWFDLGWIKNFKLSPQSKIGLVRTGVHGAVRAMYRGEIGETIDFEFRESTRMAWKIATGTIPINLIKNLTGQVSTAGPISATGSINANFNAVPIGASGYQVNGFGSVLGVPVLAVPSGSGSLFSVGDLIVCDQDYDGVSFGLVGDSAAPVFQGAVTDVDYVRKTSDYVARVTAITTGIVAGQDGLTLNGPFVGGGNNSATSLIPNTPNTGPTAGAKIQKVKGFAAREGGTFTTEWSALFILDCMDTAQIALYYPHVAPNVFKDIASWALDGAGSSDITGFGLDCTLTALAYDDNEDGETVVRYGAYYPPKNADLQI